MRVICGFLAAAIVAGAVQPAWAVCIIRGGARNCYDTSKYWPADEGPETATSADAPAGDLKSIVLQPNASSDDAWVLTPGSSDGAATVRSLDISAPACEPGLSC